VPQEQNSRSIIQLVDENAEEASRNLLIRSALKRKAESFQMFSVFNILHTYPLSIQATVDESQPLKLIKIRAKFKIVRQLH
jgi:hypothetical protein